MAKHSSGRPQVSVIVPAYNHERYVEAALQSVFDQGPESIELIVLDDQSKDDTLALAQAWSQRQPVKNRFTRIRVERNARNLGAHDSINKGLTLASGTWLTVLNSDDLFMPTRFAKLLSAADATGAQLLFSGIRVINGQGDRCTDDTLAAQLEASIDSVDTCPSVSFALLQKNVAISTGNLFFSAELYREIGGFRPMKYCHDWDFILRACLETEPCCVPEPLYGYRIHGTNSFASLKLEQYLETQAVFRNYFDDLQKKGKPRNPMAPAATNWPLFMEQFIANNPMLVGAHYMVGAAIPRFDHIARMVSQIDRQQAARS